jgi:DNA-binding NtrC family response regulator
MTVLPVKILHIEDDGIYASLVQHLLTEDNGASMYDVVQVESLKAALLQLKAKDFEAILLDLTLEDVSGLDNVRAVRSERPDLPIIVVSGHDDDKMAGRARDAGAQAFIVKSTISESMLRGTIATSLLRKAV